MYQAVKKVINKMYGKIKIADILKFIILYSIVVSFGHSLVGIPLTFLYLNDFLLVVVFIVCGEHILKNQILPIPKALALVILALLAVTIIGFVVNLYSPLLYLWGVRNNFRGFVYFVACCICLKKKDIYDICNLLLKLLPINVVLCTVQYFAALNSGDARMQMFVGDYVGGIFGGYQSCNRMLNIYLLFVYLWAFAMYMKKNLPASRFVFILACSVYIAILSELKVVVLEVLIGSVALVWILRRRRGKLFYTVAIIAGLLLLINVWSIFNPALAELFSSIEMIIEYSSANSYGEESLNRLTVIPTVYELFLEGSPLKVLFGIGMGNADSSNYAFLTSQNFIKYGYLKYSYFMSGILFAETGALGLLLYFMIFVANFLHAAKCIKKYSDTDAVAYAGTVFNLIAIVCILYNTTLRSEVSNYLAFFFLAIPIVMANRGDDEQGKILSTKQITKRD